MAGRSVSPVFVGRIEEQETARKVLDRVIAGAATHLLVGGEAGVGKTRYTAEIERLAASGGFLVLHGGCVALGGMGLPYAPIAALLRDAMRSIDLELREGLGSYRVAALAELAPGVAGIDDVAGASASQAILFEALLSFFQHVAQTAPLLLIVEDLHWADPATRDALAFLIPNLAGDRIAFCLTYRTDELDRRHPLLPWLAELRRSGRFEHVALTRLDRDETAHLVGAITGSEPSDPLVERIHRRADGNAFFIEELLMASGTGPGDSLPDTVRATLMARVSSAPESAQRVLRVVSVAGRHVDDGVLSAVARLDRDELDAGLRAAVDAHLLTPDVGADADGYAFRHALVQEAVYDDLLPGERRALHRAYAEELAERSVASGAAGAMHWAELAHHWGSAHDEVRAAEASIRAGDAALATFAFANAGRYFERVLELWDSVPDAATRLGIDRVELLGRAGRAVGQAGDFRRAVDLDRAALAVNDSGDSLREALLNEQLGRALWQYGDTDAALASYRAAVSMLPTDRSTQEQARVLAGMGQMLMLLDRFSESIAFCDDAMTAARDVGDRQIEGHAMNSKGVCLVQIGETVEGIATLEASLAIAREARDPDDVARAYVNLTETLRFAGRDREALDLVSAGIAEIEPLGVRQAYGPVILHNGTQVAFAVGDWELADEFNVAALRTPRSGVNPEVYAVAYSIGLAVARGDPAAGARLDRLLELIEGRRALEGQYASRYTLARAEHELWHGRPAAAVDAVAQGLAWLEPNEFQYMMCLVHAMGARAQADLAELARASRGRDTDVEAAVARIDEHIAAMHLAIAKHGSQPGAREELSAALLAAEAERTRAAGTPDADRWRAAIDAWGARDRPYEAAYARWRRGEAQLAFGDRAAAREDLTAAAAWASSRGAAPLLAELESLARRARIDLTVAEPAETPDAPGSVPNEFGLTKREKEVLALIAVGRTNRQIADHLFITENTVGVHVGNILGKLNASSRTEAAGIAHRLGLVGEPAEG